MAKFSPATNERYKDKDGQWQDRTEWHNLLAWQRTAEIVGEYMKRGSKVYIEGSLRTSSWDDKSTGREEISYRDCCQRPGAAERAWRWRRRLSRGRREDVDKYAADLTIAEASTTRYLEQRKSVDPHLPPVAEPFRALPACNPAADPLVPPLFGAGYLKRLSGPVLPSQRRPT